MRQLFRPEAIEKSRPSLLGEVSLSRPPSASIFACIGAGACIAALLIGIFGTYTRKTTVAGQLVSDRGLVSVASPIQGNVSELLVAEGAIVAAGDSIATILAQPGDADEEGAAHFREGRDKSIAALRLAQAASEETLLARERGIKSDLENTLLEREILAKERDRRIAQSKLGKLAVEQYRRAAEEQLISRSQLTQQEISSIEREAVIDSLDRQDLALRTRVSRLGNELDEIRAALRESRANASMSTVELEDRYVRDSLGLERVIRAPIAGSVAVVHLVSGEAVGTAGEVISILPAEHQLHAMLHVPSRGIGLIEIGQRVSMRVEAFPHARYGLLKGEVARISATPVSAVSSGGGEPAYRVIVVLDTQLLEGRRLLPGMAVSADVWGESMSVFEWLFEPVIARWKSIGSNLEEQAPLHEPSTPPR